MATGLELLFSTICNASFCKNVYDNPFIDSRLTNKQTEILNLIHNLNGKKLKIGTYNNYPLSWVEKDANGTLRGRGVAFSIVEILRQKFNFTFEVIVPEKNYEFGFDKPESSLVGLVNSSKVDMAAAFLPKLVEFNKMVTYSNDLDEGVWMMMLKRPKESAAGSGLLAPFETYVWYLILVAVICYGPCITLLTRIRSKLVQDKEGTIQMSPSVWFVYGSFIKQGTNLAPEANTTRVLFATWWIFIILLSAFYTANLTAFLTLSKFTLDIENPKDLFKKSYRWVSTEGGAVQMAIRNPDDELYYLNKMVLNGRAQFYSLPRDEAYLPIVKGGAVLVKEQTAIDHLMYGDYQRKAREGVAEGDRCTYVVAPHSFMKRQRAFAYPNNTTLKTLFDTVITHLLQAGIVNFMEHRDLPSTKICPLDLQSKDRQLRNSDLLMTYVIMAVGIAAAAAVFIGELFIKRSLRNKINDNGTKDKRRRKKSNKVRFMEQRYDDSRPPPYDSLFGGKSRYDITSKTQRKIINGREYFVMDTGNGGSRLIPVRTPSAFLYQ
ncbi:glutamate receptor ionotropic, delta-2 [Battus philenor]|uniref:glutamate receptor ionotropic, delta-2 n=1 Tax=Battus philenor TaxID=42288 RepID=UPI0035D064E2